MRNALIFFSFLFLTACSKPTAEADQSNPSNAPITKSATKQAKVQNIGLDDFKALDGKFGVFVIDVRTPSEINEGKIRGAIDMDISDPAFNGHLAKFDKEKSYVVYCKSGGRSSRAAKTMIEMGFQNVYNLEGGYTAWEKAQAK